MKRTIHYLLLVGCCFLGVLQLKAQVSTVPAFPTADMTGVKIIYDATQGTSALQGVTSVHLHTGVILSGPTGTGWTNVVTEWGNPNSLGQMTKVAGEANKWEFTFPGTIRQFYNVAANTPIYRLGLVFRESGPCGGFGGNSNACKEGKTSANQDIFVDLFQGGLQLTFTEPTTSGFLVGNGDQVNISVETSETANITFSVNGVNEPTVMNTTSASTQVAVSEDFYKVIVTASNGSQTVKDSVSFLKRIDPVIEDLPSGIIAGINEIDDNTITLALEAPNKKFVYVVGDFNNWELNTDYQFKKSNDGNFHWFTLTGLEAGKEYAFQYLVYDEEEDIVRVTDPYAEKVLFDSDNDARVANNYPNLKPYPTGKTVGPVGILQTAQAPFNFSDFTRPAKEELIIYELLVRDFDTPKNFQAVIDRLDYLQDLGVNAIELMPVMEFNGNESWGYNPIFFCAVDKSYGTENDLKELIEACHQRGIAVILDMVLNHAEFECPLVKMYAEGFSAAPDNPWFNQQATHPFSVFYDFNHESQFTKDFIDRVNAYWLTEYKFDGFRFDLSKGFTQNTNCGASNSNVGCWNSYDASRVAILKRMADAIWAVDPNAYVILEHLGVDQEEIELANYRIGEGKGMMPWGIMHQAYKQNSLGFSQDSDLSRIYAKNRTFGAQTYQSNNLIGYMESHDEERLMYENLQFGNSMNNYNVRNLNTGLKRIAAVASFFFTVPGPKMLWQFGELGYDISINEGGRLGEKPIRWDYLQNPQRKQLYDVFSALIALRKSSEVFEKGQVTFSGGTNLLKQLTIRPIAPTNNPTNADQLSAVIVGNFDVTTNSLNANFPHTGTWYDYFEGNQDAPLEVTNQNTSLNLAPGEFKVFVNFPLPNPNLVLALEDELVKQAFSLVGNPGSHLKVTWEGTKFQNIDFKLLDTYGRLMKSFQPINQKSYTAEVNLTNLPAGIYFLEINTEKGRTVKRVLNY
ncbi:MAG: alpha-amylase family glycosyl hydrolase [Microscillaceae bacterium]|nr:alpha-amylase family glycosyl hydrolase [Microscillaceae bacterium]